MQQEQTRVELGGILYHFYTWTAKGEAGQPMLFLALYKFCNLIGPWGQWELYLTRLIRPELVKDPIRLVKSLLQQSEVPNSRL